MPKRPRKDDAAQPHDRLVQFAFSRREHAAGLLKAVLPREIREAVTWRTLKLENRSFVNRALRGRHIDLLFSARLRGEPIYFYYLIEQQRKVEPLMILRLGTYMWRAWEQMVADDPTRNSVPPIYPILLHHSAGGWTAATAFQDIVAIPDALRPLLAPHTPSFEMVVIDVSPGQASRIAVEMLTAFGKVVLWCLSVADDDARFQAEIGPFAEVFGEMLDGRDGADALHAVLRYLLATHRRMSAPAVERMVDMAVSPRHKKVIMEEFNVFRIEGRREGRATLLLAQLRARFGRVPAEAKEKILAANDATLQRWGLRMLTAPTLEDALAEHTKKATPARRRARAA